jgi:hypothetical protein
MSDICVKGSGQPFSSARLMKTEIACPIAALPWTRDSKFIPHVRDSVGDQPFNGGIDARRT